MTQKVELYEVITCLLLSKGTGYVLSTSQQQNQDRSRSGIIFTHTVDVTACLWCSQLTPAIINRAITVHLAHGSFTLFERDMFYLYSLPCGLLTDYIPSPIFKGELLTHTSPGFPSDTRIWAKNLPMFYECNHHTDNPPM